MEQECARLEDGRCVAEDVVHCARDCALAVKLPVRVCIQRVLVAFDGAAPKCALVALDLERDCLVVDSAGGVADREVLA